MCRLLFCSLRTIRLTSAMIPLHHSVIVSIPHSAFHQRASGVLFAETENVAVRVLDVKIKACPRSFFEGLDHVSPTHLQLAEQASDTGHGNVRVQMLVLFPVRSVSGQFRRVLEVYRESVTSDARIERLILEIELEAEPVTITIVRNRLIKIVDEKLRGDPRNLRSTVRHPLAATRRPFAARVVEKLIDQCSSRPHNRFDPRARFLVTGSNLTQR
jgi:hypothetical protein